MNANIQVLRGISVILVLFYHLELYLFSFGYLGVDVFFVLSGFLMPLIQDKYTPILYLKARLKRLFPLLLIVCSVSLVLGYFLQMPGELESSAKATLFSLGNLSFYYFMTNTGYFDSSALLQPLLHTWSLGNEVVGYVLVFISLYIVKKYKQSITTIPWLIVIISTIYIITADSIDYLDPLPRLYVFFVSYLVSYFLLKNNNINININILLNLISFISCLLLILLFGEDIWNKIWPNTGIILIPFIILPLIIKDKPLLPKIVTSILNWFGDISYSLYLWHWPIICFERVYFRNMNINSSEVILLGVISILIGWLSFKKLERPSVKVWRGMLLFLLPLVVCVSIATIYSEGFTGRVPSNLIQYSNLDKMTVNHCIKEYVDGIENCIVDKDNELGKETLFVMGDSHSRHLLGILKNYSGKVVRLKVTISELNVKNIKYIKYINKLINEKNSKLLIAYRFNSKSIDDIESLINSVNVLSNSNTRIFIMRDIPAHKVDPVACAFAYNSNLKFKKCKYDPFISFPLKEVANKKSPQWKLIQNIIKNKAVLIDTHNLLCNQNDCKLVFNGQFIMRDHHHFNEALNDKTNYELYHVLFKQLSFLKHLDVLQVIKP
jgi:peptidoglycan/LPS O-acetylase OafA/YrhL